MAAFDDDLAPPPKKATPHEIGQNLDALSAQELAERVAALKAEIERLEQALAKRGATHAAAQAFFKS